MSDQFVIHKPNVDVARTSEYKYPTGSLNHLDRRTVTKNLCIDSLFRKNYNATSSSNFTFVLNEPINNVVSMTVNAMEFPNAWYTFSSVNQSNEFTITIYNAPNPLDNASLNYRETPVITHVIKIPDGNYRSDVLRDTINNMFTNIRGGLEFIYFDINEVNTHCIFRSKTAGDDNQDAFLNGDLDGNSNDGYNPPNPPFSFEVDFRVEKDITRPLYKNAGWMLGFRKATYTVNQREEAVRIAHESMFNLKEYNWYLESESSYGSNIQNYVFLELDDHNKNFNTNKFLTNSYESQLGNNVIGRISVVSGMNTIITNTQSDFIFKKRDYFGPVKIERIHIKLLNKLGEPIELNGNDFSFMIEFEQLYS
tara:strand:+ start:2746 stop:3843 length:1098 start_codon:yes stop_codon:yes gene_type:complete